MISTSRLKVWTMISHACIIIGMGHGVLTLGIAEAVWIIAGAAHKFSFDTGEAVFFWIGIICLLGQIAFFASIFEKRNNVKRWFHIGGLCLLWASVAAYAYAIRNDAYSTLVYVTCLPLAYCTTRPFLVKRIVQRTDGDAP